MDLAAYRTAIEAALGAALDPDIWSTAVLDAALTEALREYQEWAPLVEDSVTVTTGGFEQDLSTAEGLYKVYGVAWPWYEGAQWHERAALWAAVDETTVRFQIEGPSAGDVIRVRYRRTREVEDLNGATTTVRAADEGLLVAGAAVYAALIRYRQLVELEDPPAGALVNLWNWAMARRADYRRELEALALAGLSGGITWGRYGL